LNNTNKNRGRVMRHLTAVAITAALVGAAILLTSGSAAAAYTGAPHAQASAAQAGALVIQAHAPAGQCVGQGMRGDSRAGGGGGGGGDAAAAAGIAGATMTGIIPAEEVRAAVDQETAIAQNARRHHPREPQTHTCIGRDGRITNCP
jgi:hypothetical protein